MVFQISSDSRYYVFSQPEWEKRSYGKESNESSSAIQMLPTQMLWTLAVYMPTISYQHSSSYSYFSDLCSRKNQAHTRSKKRLQCFARSIHTPKLPSRSSVRWLSLETENWHPTQRMGQWVESNRLLASNHVASKSGLRWHADRLTLSLPTSNDLPSQNFLTGSGLRAGLNGLAVNEDLGYTRSIKCFEWQCIWATHEGESFFLC